MSNEDLFDQMVADFTVLLPADEATPDAAFRHVARQLKRRFGPVGLAVISMLEDGRARVVGASGPEGAVEIPVHGYFEDTESLPVLEGAEPVSRGEVARVHLADGAKGAGKRLFERYPWALGMPLLLVQQRNRRLVLLAEEREILEALDPEHSALFTNLAVNRLVWQLDNQRLNEANRWINRQLDEIASLQRLLLPSDVARIRGVTIATDFQSYRYAGGDYYDLTPLTHHVPDWPDGVGDFFGVLIADVSGHGPAAAVEAAMMDAILRTYSAEGVEEGPAPVLTYLNRYLFTRQSRPAFITAFAGSFDPRDRVFRCVSAGHPPVFVIRGDSDEAQPLEMETAIPLRVDPDYTWTNHEERMERGDVLVMYTDGVIEMRSRDGSPFGVEGVRRAASGCDGEPQAVVDSILAAQTRHRDGEPPDDDQTIIVVRFDD